MRLIIFTLLAATGGFFLGLQSDQVVSTSSAHVKTAEQQMMEDQYPSVRIPANVVHNLGIRFDTAKKGDLQRSIETIGKITRVDPMARQIIAPPIQGTLDYVIDKHDGQFIEQGELLFAVVSEELFELQKNYQTTYQSGDSDAAMKMVPHLRQMGLNEKQLAALRDGAVATFPVEVYARENSYIFERRVSEGDFVRTASTIFSVGGHYNVVEVTAEIFERQWSWVDVGQKATMTVRGIPGAIFEGTVVRVQPPVGYTTRSLETALKFNTDDAGLSQSMFANVQILVQAKEDVLLIPQEALIRTQNEQRVIRILGDGSYQPVAVDAGEEAGGMVEIRSGLDEGDKIVTSGQFLIDSESNLLVDFSRMSSGDAASAVYADQHHHHHH
ncbi:MAG: efflux RND transporter periplasmic adaptor subunit [Burkholderiales bacterium]|nr:efflux RND transporter periplasmic adaptor subunit [Burkholderiales bacterium]MDR4517855.1 efflux RND transporter periplasmic adaptor subunit [Nitrosomonas sp.]